VIPAHSGSDGDTLPIVPTGPSHVQSRRVFPAACTSRTRRVIPSRFHRHRETLPVWSSDVNLSDA
jgi:hypothetical protein